MINIDNLITIVTHTTLKFLLLVAMAGFARVGYAELYKWVDADGNVNYSQSPPPPGIQGTTIKPPPAIQSDTARDQLDQRLNSLNKISDQRQKQAEQQRQSEAEKQEQQRRCSQARSRLASYEKPRVSIPGADGVPMRLGEEERLAELEKSRGQVSEYCK